MTKGWVHKVLTIRPRSVVHFPHCLALCPSCTSNEVHRLAQCVFVAASWLHEVSEPVVTTRYVVSTLL
jgi:hypothetical protein